MRKIIILAMVPLMSLSVSVLGFAADAPMDMPDGVHVKEVATAGGPFEVLADSNGMTLYTFDMDRDPGRSVCTGQCAALWPPLLASEGAEDQGSWTIVTQPDGARIWAYHGKPLYTFVKDKVAADFNGNGLPQDNPVWHCALPK